MQRAVDEMEIVDVMNQYTTALDTRNWEMLEATMAPDGQADFGNLAGVGVLESPQALVELCRKSLQDLRATQHLQGNYVVMVNGDTAQASCYLQANHFQEGLPGGDTFVVWAKYRDDFVRTGGRLADQEALSRHDLRRREHEPLHRGRRGGGAHDRGVGARRGECR